jgi:hypothetical protein
VFERKSHQAEDPRETENAENLDEDQKLALTSIVTLADSSKNIIRPILDVLILNIFLNTIMM